MGQNVSRPPVVADFMIAGTASERLDLTLNLTDDCLAVVFSHLSASDRNRCALVCRRWLAIDSLSRHRLTLHATSSLPLSNLLSSRFRSILRLTLRCDRLSFSLTDAALSSLSSFCPLLLSLRLKACRHLSDAGFRDLRLPRLTDFSASSCSLDAAAIASLLSSSPALESISLKRLRCFSGDPASLPASRLRRIRLKELFNAENLAAMVMASPQLESLTVIRCSGDWDQVLETARRLIHLHLERSHVTDRGLLGVAKCSDLETLNLLKTPECSDAGIAGLTTGCKRLRQARIDGWRMNRIGDVGIAGFARNCQNLRELVLVGVNPTAWSLVQLGEGCSGLERLALCGSETIGDGELAVVAAKFRAMRKLCIKGCPVSDVGLRLLADGCPELAKVQVRKCRRVSVEGMEALKQARLNRFSGKKLEFELDEREVGKENSEILIGRTNVEDDAPSSTSLVLRAKMTSLFSGRNAIVGIVRRWQ